MSALGMSTFFHMSNLHSVLGLCSTRFEKWGVQLPWGVCLPWVCLHLSTCQAHLVKLCSVTLGLISRGVRLLFLELISDLALHHRGLFYEGPIKIKIGRGITRHYCDFQSTRSCISHRLVKIY